MKKRVEIIPADHDVQLNFYIITASYILLLISIEPITDYFLMININGMNLSMINVINEKKKFITHTAYGMLRMLPMLLLAWFAYRVIASARLPPAQMKLPFSLPLKTGRTAKIVGLCLMTLSLLFIAQGIVYTVQALVH